MELTLIDDQKIRFACFRIQLADSTQKEAGDCVLDTDSDHVETKCGSVLLKLTSSPITAINLLFPPKRFEPELAPVLGAPPLVIAIANGDE